ncbi:MAG: hypothetical protein RL131_1551, partial [Bacteroidota bacterium]
MAAYGEDPVITVRIMALAGN